MPGMQEGRNAGGQECRQTDRCTVRQMYMYIHTEIKTYRHTQTNRQTDSAEVQEGRQKNIQMYRKTIAYLKTDRQTDRQTERQNRQAQNIQAQKDKGTDRQIEGSISVLCKNIQIEI
jgi:hypothetical protein